MSTPEERMMEIARGTPAGEPTTEPISPVETPPDGSVTPPPDLEAAPAEPVVAPPYEYRHPMLRGRTPEEVERLFEMQEQVAREQGARLTSVEKQMSEARSATPPEPAPDESAQDFFENPSKVIRRHLDATVAPLREEIREAKAYVRGQDSRASLKAKYADWDVVEPYVDWLLTQQPFPDPNDPGLLGTLYLTAKGIMIEQGIDVHSSATPSTPPAAPAQPAAGAIPPQHAASTPPAPPPRPAAPGGGQTRPLTETEKRLAREYKMTPEQYIRFQEMELDEVADADFDKPKEGQ